MPTDLSGPALRAAFFERCLGWKNLHDDVWSDQDGIPRHIYDGTDLLDAPERLK